MLRREDKEVMDLVSTVTYIKFSQDIIPDLLINSSINTSKKIIRQSVNRNKRYKDIRDREEIDSYDCPNRIRDILLNSKKF